MKIGKLFKACVDIAILPLDVVKDICTLGGATIDEESSIKQRIDKIEENLDEVTK